MRVALALILLLAFAPAASAREWLAGDGHVHTCYSHDSWCPGEEPAAETVYSNFATMQQRFVEASAKGLDFLVISDHNTIEGWSDPAFGSQGVLGVRAYEASLSGGHAHAIGVDRLYDGSDIAAMADAVRADGGLFQVNHPAEGAEAPVETCEDAADPSLMDWDHGFSVRPSLIEVWNPTTSIPLAELYWECWLQRGERMPAGAGSDSHGALTAQLGNPTLWVLAEQRSQSAIVRAMAAGRTTITRRAPAQGAMRLLLKGPRGTGIGDTVRPGSVLTARVDGLDAPGYITVRANGRTIVDRAPVQPGGSVSFTTPTSPGWVRAKLHMTPAALTGDPNCTPNGMSAQSPFVLCSDDLVTAALTSPMYLADKARKKSRKRK